VQLESQSKALQGGTGASRTAEDAGSEEHREELGENTSRSFRYGGYLTLEVIKHQLSISVGMGDDAADKIKESRGDNANVTTGGENKVNGWKGKGGSRRYVLLDYGVLRHFISDESAAKATKATLKDSLRITSTTKLSSFQTSDLDAVAAAVADEDDCGEHTEENKGVTSQFTITVGKVTWRCKASSATDRTRWMEALQANVKLMKSKDHRKRGSANYSSTMKKGTTIPQSHEIGSRRLKGMVHRRSQTDLTASLGDTTSLQLDLTTLNAGKHHGKASKASHQTRSGGNNKIKTLRPAKLEMIRQWHKTLTATGTKDTVLHSELVNFMQHHKLFTRTRAATKAQAPAPQHVRSGYLLKEGHKVKNWKLRYVVLSEDTLR
jgi:hypothetical protein